MRTWHPPPLLVHMSCLHYASLRGKRNVSCLQAIMFRWNFPSVKFSQVKSREKCERGFEWHIESSNTVHLDFVRITESGGVGGAGGEGSVYQVHHLDAVIFLCKSSLRQALIPLVFNTHLPSAFPPQCRANPIKQVTASFSLLFSYFRMARETISSTS